MPRLLIILLISCAYIGCAVSVPTPADRSGAGGPAAAERPRPGGSLRVLVGSGLSEASLARGCVALPLAEGGLADSVLPPEPDPSGATPPLSDCWRFVTGPVGAGGAFRPEELIAEWKRDLRDSAAPHRWLLEPVLGAGSFVLGLSPSVEGLRPEEDGLSVCTDGPAPDLRERLSHPALWFPPPARAGEASAGQGPFRPGDAGWLDAVPRAAGGPPYLERVRAVDDRGAPGLLLRLGEADLGVVLGADAGELLDSADGSLRLERIEHWDRVYYFWLDSGRRWVNDPRFRRWLGSVVDRQAMLAYLFDGRGEPAAGLLPGEPLEPAPPGPASRPLSSVSRPRLQICFDVSDPLAASIAARARAVLELHGVELVLDPRDAAGLAGALTRGDGSIFLLAHRPGVTDPVLGLMESLFRLPGLPPSALQGLHEGSRRVDPRERRLAARRVEADLLRGGNLIPLVRLHAWLAADPALRGVWTGADGLLLLERAWWAR